MSVTLATVSYIGATILFILSLGGLSNPETSRRGNLYGMIGMTIAVLATVMGPQVTKAGYGWIAGAMAIGACVGIYAARTCDRRRDLHQRADGDDAGNRIGDAHQRRMQRRRDVPDHHVADEAGQYEHREVGEKRRGRVGADEPEHGRRDQKEDRGALGRGGLAPSAVAVPLLLRRLGRGGRFRRSGGRRGKLGRGRRPGDAALLDDCQAADGVVFHIDVDHPVLGLAQFLGKTEQVGPIQRRGLLR